MSRWLHRLVLWLPVLLVLALYAPTLSGGLLSDELALLCLFTEPEAAGGGIRWAVIGEHFTGPWAFGAGNYYRPLVTTMFLVEYWLGGGAGWPFHLAAVGTYAAAVGAFVLFARGLIGPWAAVAGGCFLAVHPAAHEPACWVCTRADFLVLLTTMLALRAFHCHLLSGRGRSLAAAAASAVLGLLCKESGLLLPAFCVLLDLQVRGLWPCGWRRLLPHVWLLPVWLGYFAWRYHLFGELVGAAHGSVVPSLATWWQLQLPKLQLLFAPSGPRLPLLAPFVVGLLTGAAVLAALLRQPRLLAHGLIAMLVGLLPSQWLELTPSLWGSRFVLAGSWGVALLVGAMVAAAGSTRWLRWLLLAAATAALAAGTMNCIRHFRQAWRDMVQVRADADAIGANADPARPLALAFVDNGQPLLPFLWPGYSFPLAEVPVVSGDHPFVDLAGCFEDFPRPWFLSGDAGPFRALWQQGASVSYRVAQRPGLCVVPGPPSALPVPVTAGAGRFRFAAPASVWPVGSVVVAAAAPFDTGELSWTTAGANPRRGRCAIGAGQPTNGGFAAEVALDDRLDLLFDAELDGGLAELQVTLSQATGAVAATALTLMPAPPLLPLPRRLAGARRLFTELDASLAWSVVPADADPVGTGVVLMTPWRPLRFQRTPAGLFSPFPFGRLERELRRWSHRDQIYYYIEWQRAGRTWRSQIDWFELVLPPA